VRRCRGLAGVTEEYPFGFGTTVFKVGGKMFALVSVDETPARVSLKCDPGYAEAVREEYAAVTPGYHLNKRHWNTVVLDGSVPAGLVGEWIEDSYGLVVDGLSRRERERLLGDEPAPGHLGDP
jgi:predicted DNA-binding protein (MmcQ/YjbR family)